MDIENRIKELRAEAKSILESKQNALDIVNKCDMRLLEIQGALQELNKLLQLDTPNQEKLKK